jgi:hypothetical protein
MPDGKQDEPPKKMLILRGTAGEHEDETGRIRDYPEGALHVEAAKEYARRKGFVPVVLDLPGEAGNHKASKQTMRAIEMICGDKSITALYGFSGGGYSIFWIIRRMDGADLNHLELIVVLGVETRHASRSSYEASTFKDPKKRWALVYMNDPPKNHPAVKGKDPHMYAPEALLAGTSDPNKKKP